MYYEITPIGSDKMNPSAIIISLLICCSGGSEVASNASNDNKETLQEQMDRQILADSIVNNGTDIDEMKKVLKLLKDGEDLVKPDASQDVIILMGNTGAGKSAFSLFITGNDKNLISVETIKNSGEFIIEDVSGKVSTGTWTSWTIYPELIIDSKTSSKFYDCPGFSDTRGVAHDITATYFTKEAIKNTRAVKLVFVVGYPAVRVGVDRQDFMMFAEHVTKAVTHIEKFKDSLALIITKVDNIPNKEGLLVSDETVIETIADFLRKLKSEVHRKVKSNSNYTSRESDEKIITFLEILLQKEGDYYPRIGIFRRADQVGFINKIKLLQERKKSLERIVHKNIKYIEQVEADFDYTISANSKYRISELVEIIKDNIASDLASLTGEIERNFSAMEEEENDIEDLHERFQVAHKLFTDMIERDNNLQNFVDSMVYNMKVLNMTISMEPFLSLTRYNRYLGFLVDFGARIIKPSEWNQNIITLIQYVENSKTWLAFLIKFSSSLSSYNVQKNVEDCSSVADKFIRLWEAPYNFSKGDHEQVQEKLAGSCDLNSDMDYNKLLHLSSSSPVKFGKLKLLIDVALKSKANIFCDKIHKNLTVSGYFVKLSDVSQMLQERSCGKIYFVQIFALKKVFIDSDLDLSGEETSVSIISPSWVIVGRHKIVLDGNKPSEQEIQLLSKIHGHPGLPGGPAGNFLGAGDIFVNGNNLSISANGGRGGHGKKGKNGEEGSDGSKPSSSSRHILDWDEYHECKKVHHDPSKQLSVGSATAMAVGGLGAMFMPPALPLIAGAIFGAITCYFATPYEQEKCIVKGKSCSDGSDGGDGGVGGIGGRPGRINMISLGDDSMVSLSARNGENGLSGSGGEGGREGRSGKRVQFLATKIRNVWKIEEEFSDDLHECKPGKKGKSAGNFLGQREPRDLRDLMIPVSKSLNDFVSFARDNLNNNVWKTHLKRFLCEKLNDPKRNKLMMFMNDISSECFEDLQISNVPHSSQTGRFRKTSNSTTFSPSESVSVSLYLAAFFLLFFMIFIVYRQKIFSNAASE